MNKNHNVQLGVAKECWVAKLVLQNENFSWNCTRSDRLALPSTFGLCFMSVCLIKSVCYSLIYSSLNGQKTMLSHGKSDTKVHKKILSEGQIKDN